jgi:hypothetical protein
MRWTRAASGAIYFARTNDAVADGKIVWSWRPDAGVKLRGVIREATVARKPGHRGERDISRKTIARGMPGVSGVTVVTNACAFYATHAAAGASSARHSLRPRSLRARGFRTKLARTSGEIAKLWLFENLSRRHSLVVIIRESG